MMNLIRSILFFTLILICTHSNSASMGDLLISEVMSNPAQVSDTNGEWFEIFNASARVIDINGFTISDNASNLHVIDNAGSLIINPGSYLVLGRNSDMDLNGGYFADYVYNNFTLGNSNDQIILSNQNTELARLDYSGAAFGVAGISSELILQSSNPSLADYQLTQNASYGLGDIGTPGSHGSVVLSSANPIPVPGAIWLFLSATLLLVRNTRCKFQSASISTQLEKTLAAAFRQGSLICRLKSCSGKPSSAVCR